MLSYKLVRTGVNTANPLLQISIHLQSNKRQIWLIVSLLFHISQLFHSSASSHSGCQSHCWVLLCAVFVLAYLVFERYASETLFLQHLEREKIRVRGVWL